MKYSLRVLVSLLFFCFSAQSVTAGGELPVVSGKAVLVVVGDGYGHREILEDGEQPSLSALGSSLPDGVYRYEFRSLSSDGGNSSPRQQTYQQPQGRSVDYGQRMSKGEGANTVSGRFEIKGGALILP